MPRACAGVALAFLLCGCVATYKPVPFGTKTVVVEYRPVLPDVSVSAYALSPCVPTEMALPPSRPPTAEEAMREVQRSRESLRRCIARHNALIEQTKAALGTIRNDHD